MFPLKAEIMEKYPQNIFPTVKKLGTIDRETFTI
jgi:hypothetical protein